MSKTIENQIEKCRLLAGKLKEKGTDAENLGITAAMLADLEGRIGALAEANRECDELHKTVSERVKKTNMLFVDVKDMYTEMKKKVKARYPQEQWADYGVPDKR